MKQDNRKVLITRLPLEKDRKQVFAIVKRSRLLINSICEYSKDLKKKGIKVFERQVNIIRTEAGYFCAFYEEDLKENKTQQYKEEEVKEFEGIDGRMKVLLHDKDGEEIVKDVAELAAMFIDNPNNYKYVKHKDGNVKNNNINNLYWSKNK
jgi:hypothetical protein